MLAWQRTIARGILASVGAAGRSHEDGAIQGATSSKGGIEGEGLGLVWGQA